MMHPSVSVVIPTYNRGPDVFGAVESVLAQTAPALEVLVVDDGSNDDTQERLAAFGDRIRRLRQENRGVSAARNLGVENARGEFVAFLDSDDVWHPRKLEIQAAALASEPGLGLLCCERFDWPAQEFPDVSAMLGAKAAVVPWRRLAVKNYFATSSVIVRREVLAKVGGFDTALQGPEDHDLWLRIAEAAAVAMLPVPLTGYRQAGEGSLSKQAESMQAGMRRILAKLDARGAWRGDWLLRRKAYSYERFSTSYIYLLAGSYGAACRGLLGSLALYPLPYRRDEANLPLIRPRVLLAAIRRGFRKRPATPSFTDRVGAAS